MKLSKIEIEVKSIAEKIKASNHLLPTFKYSIGDGTPNIEIDDLGLFHYVISERGNEYDRKIFNDKYELFYCIFSSITFNIACDYELKNRIENQDCRKIIFEKQTELMSFIDSSWKAKIEKEHFNTLSNYPFNH
tara:strand:- start:3704 stop:4105 length:402 start_codon:yes stop_codon:yes gene_type:complete